MPVHRVPKGKEAAKPPTPATLRQARPGATAQKQVRRYIQEAPTVTQLSSPNFELVCWVEVNKERATVRKVIKPTDASGPTIECEITSKTDKLFTVHIDCSKFIASYRQAAWKDPHKNVQVQLEVDGEDMGAQITDWMVNKTILTFEGLQIGDDAMRPFRFAKPHLKETGYLPPEDAIKALGTIRVSCRRAKWIERTLPADVNIRGNLHDRLDEKAKKGKLAHLSSLDKAIRAKAQTVTVFVEAHPDDEEIPMQVFLFKYNSEGLLKALKKKRDDSFLMGPGCEAEPIEIIDSEDDMASAVDEEELRGYMNAL